jgi:hypothetical protein
MIGQKSAWNNIIKRSEIKKEAIRCNPLYHQEFETAFQSYRKNLPKDRAAHPDRDLIESFQSSDEGKKLCKRWGLEFALHPEDKLWDVPLDHAPALFQDPGEAVKVIPHEKTRLIPVSDEESLLDHTTHLKNDRYLKVEIDLYASKTQIKGEIEYRVKRYQNLIIEKQVLRQDQNQEGPPPPSTDLPVGQWIAERQKQREQRIAECRKQVEKDFAYRRRGLSTDIYLDHEPPCGPVTIFQVWKMNKQESKTAWEIALELYPCLHLTSYQEKSANFNSHARRIHQQIVDAINRAQREIDAVTPAD